MGGWTEGEEVQQKHERESSRKNHTHTQRHTHTHTHFSLHLLFLCSGFFLLMCCHWKPTTPLSHLSLFCAVFLSFFVLTLA